MNRVMRRFERLLPVLLAALLLFPAVAPAYLDTGEETDPAHNHDPYLLIMSPVSRSAVTAGEALKIVIVLNKPFKGYNGIDVKLATAEQGAAPHVPYYSYDKAEPGFRFTSKIKYLQATQQKDGTYLVTYPIPADYHGWLWMMPEDTGDGVFNVRAGHYVLVEVKPPAAAK